MAPLNSEQLDQWDLLGIEKGTSRQRLYLKITESLPMEEAKAMAQQQQQQQQQHLMLQQQHQHQQQQQQQHQQQQQFLLLQQIQQQHKQQQAISRFPSNIDAHLRPLQRPIINQQQHQQHQQQNPNPNPNLLQNPNPMSMNPQLRPPNRTQTQPSQTPPANQAELQMAYQDAWRVCHPDFKRPFSSLEDACER